MISRRGLVLRGLLGLRHTNAQHTGRGLPDVLHRLVGLDSGYTASLDAFLVVLQDGFGLVVIGLQTIGQSFLRVVGPLHQGLARLVILHVAGGWRGLAVVGLGLVELDMVRAARGLVDPAAANTLG